MAEAAALSLGGKIAGCLIEPIQRELGYLFCFNNNIQELETRLGRLKATKNDVHAREDGEQRSWKTLGEAANLWIDEANGKITEAETVFSEKLPQLQKGCFSIKWCPNLILRFSLGRKGKKLSLVLDDLLQRGDKLPQTGVALPVPPINMPDYNGDASDLDSRRKPMEDMIELLQDKETRLIGICGMGGIGKTTFAEQVLQKVQDLHLFAFEFMLTVSSDPDFCTIQQQALKKLGFNPSSTETVDQIETAQRLRNAFDKKKVVVVLDDVWKEFDLNAIGFPLKQSDVECRCKIIYTSRYKDLWSSERNITKQIISLDLLSDQEALNLFRKKVCLRDDDDEFLLKKEIEREMFEECGRLPLALEVVGGALFEKRIYEWKDMLFSLRNHHQDHHIDQINKVLETSYDFLEHPNLKLLFLLCCLFREDQEISIETLCRYAGGLQLFEGINGLKSIRNRVYTLVDDLIRRSLIINVEALDNLKRAVKIHDVVRDVGLSIGKRHEKGFSSLMCNDVTDLKKDISEHTKIISILFQNRDLINCDWMTFGGSKLELLCLDNSRYSRIIIPVDFFQMKNNLKVLILARMVTPDSSYVSSFLYLVKLKMLSLEGMNWTKAKDLSIIGHLRELEILSFRRSIMNVLPNEISELTNLRLLDLTGCKCFISRGVLSKLTNLQELYMWNSFIDWRVSKEQIPHSTTIEDNSAAELIELSHLNKLWRLELELSHIEQVQRGVKLLSSSKLLEYFNIRMGSGRGENDFKSGDRQLILKDIEDNFSDELGDIVENKITNLNLDNSSIIWENMHVKGFLKHIVLIQCESIITLFQPSQSLSPHTSNVFGRRRDEHKIPEQFNSLETLMLDDLCRLESFCKGINEIHFGKLKILELKKLKKFLFPTKLKLQCLEKLHMDSISNLTSLCNFLAPALKELRIWNCEDLVYLFPATSVTKENISHLSKLQIFGCRMFKGIIFISTQPEEKENKSFSFHNLRELYLQSLNELVSFVVNEKARVQSALFYRNQVLFPCLEYLSIRNLPKINYLVGWDDLKEDYNRETQEPLLPNLETLSVEGLTELVSFVGVSNYHNREDSGERQNALFHPQHQLSFPCLRVLKLCELPKINYIVGYNGLQQQGRDNDKDKESRLEPHILFPILADLYLDDLSNLLHIYQSNHPELRVLLFQNLRKLRIWSCEKLKYLFFERIVKDTARHLEDLNIFDCPMMEVVMKKDDDEYDDKTGGGECISLPNYNHFFPVLENLKLNRLPELKRFCDVDYTWSLPSLWKLSVQLCLKLEALSAGCLNCPKLVTLEYNCTKETIAGDINNLLRHLFNKECCDGDGEDDVHDGGDDDCDG